MATKYQTLVSRKASFCKGKVTKTSVKKAASEYIKNAVAVAKKKGENVTKAMSAAKKSANRVLQMGCKTSTVINGRKKKRAKRRSKK